jgi:hypothetical protein
MRRFYLALGNLTLGRSSVPTCDGAYAPPSILQMPATIVSGPADSTAATSETPETVY